MNKNNIADLGVLKSVLNDPNTLQMVQEAIRKATVTPSTYTFSPATRSVFVAENLDPVIKLIVPTATPIRSLLPRTPGMGQATAWKQLQSRLDPQAGGTGTAVTFADGGTPNDSSYTFAVKTAAYKLLGRKLSVGLMHVAASKSEVPVNEELTRIKTLEVMLGEEDMIINGDSSVDTLAFDGMIKQIVTNSGTASLLTASGVSAYDEAIFAQGGGATHLFLGPRQNRSIADELQGSGSVQRIIVSNQDGAVGYAKVSKIISSATGNLIDLTVSRYMGAWAVLATLKSPAGENMVEMEDLIPLIRMDVPVTTFAMDSFVVEAAVLKLMAEPWFFKVGGLAVGNAGI